MNDKGCGIQWRDGLIESYLNKSDERKWRTVEVITPVHIMADIFQTVLLHFVVEIAEVWVGHKMSLLAALYRRFACWTENEVAFGQTRLFYSCIALQRLVQSRRQALRET